MTCQKRNQLEAALQDVREQYHQRILAELKGTKRTYREIAAEFGVSEGLVYTLSRMNKLSRSGAEAAQTVVEKT